MSRSAVRLELVRLTFRPGQGLHEAVESAKVLEAYVLEPEEAPEAKPTVTEEAPAKDKPVRSTKKRTQKKANAGVLD